MPAPYPRRPFLPDKHCGHAMDRSDEALIEKINRTQEKLNALIEAGETRDLTIREKQNIKRYGSRLRFRQTALAKKQGKPPDDRPCMKTKGLGTTHPGVGLCKHHCECMGKQDFHLTKSRYSRKALDVKLREKIDEMERANHDALNLEPMLFMLDAKVQLFLDEKQDFEPETVRSLTLLTDTIRKTVETVNNKRFQASISVEMYNLILMRMGEVLMKHVSDQETIERVCADWEKITVETIPAKVRQIHAGVIE